MQKQYIIQVSKDELELHSFSLSKDTNFSLIEGSLKESDIESDISIQLNDDHVSFKLNKEIDTKASINDQELKTKAVYFLSHEETVKLGDLILKIIDENHIQDTSNNDGATLVMSLDDIEKATGETPKAQKPPEVTKDHIQPRNLKSNGTTTSIDISELLRSEGLVDSSAKPKKSKEDVKVKNIKFSVDKSLLRDEEDSEDEEQKDTRKDNKKQKRKSPRTKKLELEKTKKNKSKDPVDNSDLFGVFSRLFATITDFTIALLLTQVIKHPVLDRNIYFWTKTLNQKIKKLDIGVIDIEFIKLIIVFLALRIVSNAIFSVGLSAFIMGATTEGGFLTKRVKSILRTPLEFLSLVLPFIDFSLILGKRTFKEVVTVGKIHYRLKVLKYTSFIIFLTIVTGVTAYKPIERYIKYKNPSSYREVTPIKNEYALSIFSLSDNYKVNYHIDGIKTERPFYMMVNRYTGATIDIQTINKYRYQDLVKQIKKVPLSEEIYPFAARYKSGSKVNDKHKKEFMSFLFLSKHMQHFQFSKFMGLSLLAANFTPEDRLIEKARSIVELTNGTYVINNSIFYFPSDDGIVVIRVNSTERIVEIYNEIILSDKEKSEDLPLERLLKIKSIDGVQVLNYLEELDQMYKAVKQSKQGADRQQLRQFLQNILITLDQYNDIQYLSLRNSINSMIRGL